MCGIASRLFEITPADKISWARNKEIFYMEIFYLLPFFYLLNFKFENEKKFSKTAIKNKYFLRMAQFLNLYYRCVLLYIWHTDPPCLSQEGPGVWQSGKSQAGTPTQQNPPKENVHDMIMIEIWCWVNNLYVVFKLLSEFGINMSGVDSPVPKLTISPNL